MLCRQTIHFLGKYVCLSNLLALNFSRLHSNDSSKQLIGCDILAGSLTAPAINAGTYLESAAFLFHMKRCDLENHQVLASRVF
jgi:hypothetical protein